MTDREKLLWAERHGVVPPASVMSRAALASAPSEATSEIASGGCCSKSSRSPKKPTAAPASQADCAKCSAPAPSQPASNAAVGNHSKNAPHATADESRVRWVSFIDAQRCSGGATNDWVNGPIGLPLTAPLHCLSLPVPVQAFVCAADPLWNSAFFMPPHRPPRIV